MCIRDRYKRIRYKGIVCDRCGVEVTEKKVRRAVSYTHLAYMPWKGYNYEDAIVLNERVVREDLLTSVHVEEYSCLLYTSRCV